MNKFALGLLALCLAGLLTACSPKQATAPDSLVWKVAAQKIEIKEQLKAVESVSQYDGSKVDMTHEQAPQAGNVYLILNLTISKIGDQPLPFDWKQLVVLDAAGVSYSRHANDSFLEQYQYTPRLTGLEMRFGENSGWLCFEIPAQAARGKLTLKYSAEQSQQEISLQP